MADDPYREPVDGDVPKAASFVPPPIPNAAGPATPVAPLPDNPVPQVPDGFIPDSSGAIHIPDTPSQDTSPAPIPVPPPQPLPTPPPAPIIQPDPIAIPVVKPLREIPLQDIQIPQQPKHGVFQAGVIMPGEVMSHEALATSNAPDASEPEPVPPPAPAIPPEPIEPEVAKKRSAIRTLQSDIAQTVENNNLSIAQIALAQQEKAEHVLVPEETKDTKSFVMGVVSTLLVLGGLAALGFVAYTLRGHLNVPFLGSTNTQITTIIPADRIETYNISTTTRTTLLARIDAFMKDPTADPLKVRALVLTETTTGTTTQTAPITLSRFMDVIGSRAPGRLVRTLGPDVMLGAVGSDPFLLTPHSSYDNAFAGMLEWEAQMQGDLPFLLFTPPAPAATSTPVAPVATTTAATSTGPAKKLGTSSPSITLPPISGTTTPPGDQLDSTLPQLPAHTAAWKDIVVRNIDARALVRDDGKVLMLYSFLQGNLLLITAHQETMGVILDILAQPHFGQ